jgi:hypothetical protein
MENQQAKSHFEMGWLAGIIDGEGWLILNEQKLPSKNVRMVPVIGVNCTSQLMIDEIQRICHKHNIGTWVGERKFDNHWKDQFVINIRGQERAKKLLDLIGHRLILKSPQAALLLRFIEYRQAKTVHDPYGEAEQAFRRELQKLNQKGKASTTK